MPNAKIIVNNVLTANFKMVQQLIFTIAKVVKLFQF